MANHCELPCSLFIVGVAAAAKKALPDGGWVAMSEGPGHGEAVHASHTACLCSGLLICQVRHCVSHPEISSGSGYGHGWRVGKDTEGAALMVDGWSVSLISGKIDPQALPPSFTTQLLPTAFHCQGSLSFGEEALFFLVQRPSVSSGVLLASACLLGCQFLKKFTGLQHSVFSCQDNSHRVDG